MNFKEKYKEDSEMIKPDAAFVKQLTEQMKAKERQQGSYRRRNLVSAAAIAAVILLVGLLGYQLLLPVDKPAPDETIPNVGGVASGGAEHGFSSSEDRERYERLVSYMESGTAFIEKSEAQDFSKAEAVSEAEIEALTERLKGMTYRKRTEAGSGTVVYYRIQDQKGKSEIFTLEDGRIVRFLESDGELYM